MIVGAREVASRSTDTVAGTAWGGVIVTDGTDVYPAPVLVVVIGDVLISSPLVAESIVGFVVIAACVVPSADATTPYGVQGGVPGTPATPPATAGTEQNFPRLLGTSVPSSMPTTVPRDLAPHWTGPGVVTLVV